MTASFFTQLFFVYFLSLSTFISRSAAAKEATAAKAVKPHIIIFVADDLGFDDVSFRGSNEFLTPNIDALAYHGRILERFYAPAVCTPSRAALLTGLYPTNTGTNILTHLNGISPPLSNNLTLMPQLFKNAGYKTNLIGKWNLGFAHKEDTPTYRGFDHHYGYWGSYIDHFARNSHMPICNLSTGYDFHRDMEVDCQHLGTYATELFTREAEDVISHHAAAQQAAPLFLLMAHAAPHDPLEAPAEEIKKFAYIKNPSRRTYAAMVSILDRSIGRVIRALERADMLEQAIIIFSADNGGLAAANFPAGASNWPLRGQKDTPWEGGHRLTAAIWSPLLSAARQHNFPTPIYIGDWLPTLAYAANIELPTNLKIDGQNMWPALTSPTPTNSISADRRILLTHDPWRRVTAYIRCPFKYFNGTTSHGQYDNVLALRELEDIDPRAQRYVIEVRNSLTSKALSKFDQQRLTQNRIEHLRRAARVHCGEMSQHVCNPLVEECLFNIESDPCEKNNLRYDEKFGDILRDMRAEVQQLISSSSSLIADASKSPVSCKLKNVSDPALHDCLWTNFLDEAVSAAPKVCTPNSTPCVKK